MNTRMTIRHTLDGYVAAAPKFASRWGGEFVGKAVQIKHIAKCRRLWRFLTGNRGTLQPAVVFHDWSRRKD